MAKKLKHDDTVREVNEIETSDDNESDDKFLRC
jgi:hypothetical protein